MITTTHIVTNALIARRWPHKLRSPGAFVVGGFAPIDLAITVLGGAYLLRKYFGGRRK